MARQKGIIKLKGTIGDITFYKSEDGYLAREKGGIDGSRIANDPAFQRTRENGAEFGRAGKAGKLLRTALRPLLLSATDSRMVGRMTQSMMKVIQADTVSIRGLRNVIDGEAELLAGFEFNIRGALSTSMFAPYAIEADRAAGKVKLGIAGFVPANMIAAPVGTTHFRMVSGIALVDFEGEAFEAKSSETTVMPWNNVAIADIIQEYDFTPGSKKPLFVVLGVAFYQQINGEMYLLKNGAFNALSIVKVDGGV